jgi:hypothetical protein
MDWARWFFDKNRMECSICRRSQKDGFRRIRCEGIETVDECPTKEMPKLRGEIKPFWAFFETVLPGLFDGMGGMQYSTIQSACDIWGVSRGERPIVLHYSLIVAAVIREQKKE